MLYEKIYTDILGVSYDRQVKIIGSDYTTEIDAYIVRNILFHFQSFPAKKQDLIVLKENIYNIDEMIGRKIDGILSASFFSGYVIEINYSKHKLILHKTNTFKAPGSDFYQFPLVMKKGRPYIQSFAKFSEIDSTHLQLLLDTGAGLPLLLHANTNSHIKLPSKLVPGKLGLGIGGWLEGYLGIIPYFYLNNSLFFSNLLTHFQDLHHVELAGETHHRNGLIGNSLLSRFRIILDYDRNMCFLKPLKKFNKSFNTDKSGIGLITSGENFNHFIVRNVIPNSPADEAGIQEGDKLLYVNGLHISFFTLGGIQKKLAGKVGKSVKLTISRNGVKNRVSFQLKEMVF